MNLYAALLRPVFFRFDPERAHEFALRSLAATPPALLRLLFGPPTKRLARHKVFGLHFPNPVGLAAGMDKNAVALPAWEALGFGFVELGTITALAQPGNPKPRVYRYPSQQALINRMGFNNAGAQAIAARLDSLRRSGRWPRIPVGINLGKSKATPLNEAPNDYLTSLRALRPYADYFVINVSSPNTPGLRDLQQTKHLKAIAQALRHEVQDQPILVKLAPDLADEDALAAAEIAAETGLVGIIATNTTLDHSSIPNPQDQPGGLSGAPLRPRATTLLRLLASNSSLPLIASGGILDLSSAEEKFAAGAQLVQLYTGFVYAGPSLIREIRESPAARPQSHRSHHFNHHSTP